MYRHRTRRSGGFTLIEVLLVLVILVVLASLAVVAYGPIQRKMQISAAKTQVELLAQALQTYQTSLGEPPANLEALRTEPGGLPQGKWGGPYLARDIPLDPWNKPYQYQVPGAHNPDSFDVWTVAPDGQQIGNWTQELKK